jgi:hypothetical protein
MEPKTYHCEECKEVVTKVFVQTVVRTLVIGECDNPACKLYHTGQTLEKLPAKKGA